MQKARRRPLRLRPLVDIRFQVLFTLLLAVLFTFPSRYLFAIGLSVVFSLGRWCCHVHARILQPRATPSPFRLRLQDFHLLRSDFPIPFCLTTFQVGLFRFRSPLLSESFFQFLFLQVLRCFSSPGSRFRNRSSTCQVSPFGHLRINGRLHLPVAFRSLPRPSSPLRAQASPVCPYSLPFFFFLTKYPIVYKYTSDTSRSYSFCLSCMSNNFLFITFETAAEM